MKINVTNVICDKCKKRIEIEFCEFKSKQYGLQHVCFLCLGSLCVSGIQSGKISGTMLLKFINPK